MLQQHTLKRNNRAYKSSRRLGRGNSSGRGTTAGRGTKGQLARTGRKVSPWFEGGQTSFLQRIPKKKGFRRPVSVDVAVLNVADLNVLENGTVVSHELLLSHKLIKKSDSVKILGEGELTKKLSVEVPCSASAKTKIEAAGGTVKELQAAADSQKESKKAKK